MEQLGIIDYENSPSGCSTSVFSWSPLPQRRQLHFTEKRQKTKTKETDLKNLYPNCDQTVWMRSCEQEITKPIMGTVTGIIPDWLQGSLIRNGPGSLKVGSDQFDHLFDSSALLHKFEIKHGQVTYQCRFLQSEIYKKNKAANRIVVTEFGTKAVPDPCHTIFERVAAIFNPASIQSDNAMISVYPFGDEIYAFNEVPIIHKIDSETLNTEKRVNLSEKINIVNHTSHPHIMKDGSVYNLGLSIYATGPYHTIAHFPKQKNTSEMFEKAKIIGSVSARWPLHPSYMHTFGVTDNFFVIVEQPLSVSVPAILAAKIKNEPMASCFRWYHDEYTRISVISKETGMPAHTFYAEAFFYLHIINQYEMSDHLVIDICAYRDPAMLDCMYIETMKSMQQNPDYAKMFRSRPIRFVLPLKPTPMEKDLEINLVTLDETSATAYYLPNGDILANPVKLSDLGCETPRINYENNLGKFYRYFYAISSDVDAENPGTLIKVDVIDGQSKKWCQKNCYPSEPIFLPNPNAKNEDDGVILAAMVWGGEDTNHVGLIILDAKTFTELGRAEFKTKSPAPKCLHGWFVPQKD